MFYPRRVVDINDGKTKWAGLDGKSEEVEEQTGRGVKRSRSEKDEGEEDEE